MVQFAALVLVACASDENGKDYFVSSRNGSYCIGINFPEYLSMSLVRSRCTRDPVDGGSCYVYRSRRVILAKAQNKHQIR